MIYCKAINDAKTIDDLKEKIRCRKQSISKDLKAVLDYVDQLSEITFKIENESRAENPHIVKRVIKYMAAGMTKDDAISATAADFETPIFRVNVIYQMNRHYMTALNLYAKKYMIEKLKNAGFSVRQMSEIIGISKPNIYKILKCPIDYRLF